MRAGAFILGLFAALILGMLVWFTLGGVWAIAIVIIILMFGFAGFFIAQPLPLVLVIAFPVLTVLGIFYGGWNLYKIVQAITDESGPSDPANAADLESARAKFDLALDEAGFRIELTEAEMTAYLQDGLSDGGTPIRRVTVDASASDSGGSLKFEAEFKSGDLTASGTVSYKLVAGSVDIDIIDIEVGAFSMPGFVRRAMDDLVDGVLDVNELLDKAGASIQIVEITDNGIVLVGTRAGGEVLTAEALLSGLRDNARSIGSTVNPPTEVYGPGDVNSTESEGSVFYVAIGDSLTANVGVDEPRDGFVSRFHAQLAALDAATLGLRNYGISGESSGTLLRGGQLDEAVEFMKSHTITFVTIDIGANDLLSHLGTTECAESTSNPGCATRLDGSLAAYRENLDLILKRITDAAPDATVIFLQTYNPFSFGFTVIGIEQEVDEVMIRLNAIATKVAEEHDVLVADGFTAMSGTTGVTTHMADASPDIHPTALGYDVLTGALVAALP